MQLTLFYKSKISIAFSLVSLEVGEKLFCSIICDLFINIFSFGSFFCKHSGHQENY